MLTGHVRNWTDLQLSRGLEGGTDHKARMLPVLRTMNSNHA